MMISPRRGIAIVDGVEYPIGQAPIPSPPLNAVKAQAVARVVAMIDAAAETIAGPVPQYERASWPTKADSARAYAGTPTASQAAIIDGEAEITGETGAQVAARIVANADAWIAAIAALTGRRRVAFAAITAAETPEQVDAALTALSAAI